MVSIKGIASPHSVFSTCEPRKTHDDVWVRWAWLETAHLRLPDSSPSGRSVRREGDFALCRYDVSALGLNHYHAHFHSDVAALQKLWFVDTLVS